MSDCKHRNVTLYDDGHRCIRCYERFVPAKYFTTDKDEEQHEDVVGNEFKPVTSRVHRGGTG